jgi:hypothetical protein
VVVDWLNEPFVLLDASNGRNVPFAGRNAQERSFGRQHTSSSRPTSVVTVPHTNKMLVVDDKAKRVSIYNHESPDNPCVFVASSDGLKSPFGVAVLRAADVDLSTFDAATAAGVDPTLVAIADTFNHRVVLFRLHDGLLVRHIGSYGYAPGQFFWPRSVAVIPSIFTSEQRHNGLLAVTDDRNNRVQVVTQLGQSVRVFDGTQLGSRLSQYLYGIAICPMANIKGQAEIIVADSDNHRLVAFALDGSAERVLCGTGTLGSGPGEFNYPAGLAVTADGDLWVCDSRNDRICLFH